MARYTTAAWLLLALTAGQDDGLERTFYEDGSPREEWEVDGAGVRVGAYRRWHPNGEDAVRGRFDEGSRTGRWRTWYETGKRESSGKYETGLRSGDWSYWSPDGELDELESGEYEPSRSEFPGGEPRSQGELKDGIRHGQWTLFWEHGPLKAQGSYRAGAWHGPWRFWWLDGSLDTGWISGRYEEGERVADLAGADDSPAVERVAIPVPVRSAPMGAMAEQHLTRRFAEYIDAPADRRAELASELVQAGRPLLSVVVRELLQLDLSDESQAARSAQWESELLAPACAGLTIGLRAGASSADLEANESARVQWATLAALMEETPALLEIDLRGLARAKPNGVLRLADWVPRVTDGAPWPSGESVELGFPYALRVGEGTAAGAGRRRAKPTPEARAVSSGLAWLAQHQSFDGAWRGTDFLENCDSAEGMACSGAGEYDVPHGLTGLAVLAFLADGSTPDYGPYREPVARAVGWLAARQQENGFLAPLETLNWIYQHAIATLALCEALRFHEDDYLRLTCERAVAILHKARNPSGAWRYDFPPTGAQDTSVTAWVVQALRAAEIAGIAVDPDTYAGALNWIGEATDGSTYRTGYDVMGSASARTSKNAAYKPTFEGLTSAALFVKYLTGTFPSESGVMTRQVELVLKRLPDWDEDGTGNDIYGWYYASQAMNQVGGSSWTKWWKAMRHTALGSQRTDGGYAGSWDIDTAWGYYGGRVYSTAMMVLCLQAGQRLQRFEEGDGRADNR